MILLAVIFAMVVYVMILIAYLLNRHTIDIGLIYKLAFLVLVEETLRTGYMKYSQQVKDTHNYVYEFWLRSQENLDMAYNFMLNNR